jgi:hypothetical protein
MQRLFMAGSRGVIGRTMPVNAGGSRGVPVKAVEIRSAAVYDRRVLGET